MINIIIGENNSGKTAIIDALKIYLGYEKSDANIYIQGSEVERESVNNFISQYPENIELQTIQFHLNQNGRRTFFKKTVKSL